MAIRKIRIVEDEILRKKARRVEKFDDKLKELIEDMFETMEFAQGVGLAAPQIGLLRRVIVADDREENRMALINPEIVEKSGEEIDVEGCLSIPNKQGHVKRATFIKVKYNDVDGTEKELEAYDYFARILQHEIDHTNGVLYTDIAEDVYDISNTEEENK